MKSHTRLILLVFFASMCMALAAWAGGDRNAHNNPTGAPPSLLTPYANMGDGRMMVFCAEDEKLVLTPVDGSAVDVSCVLAED